MKTQAYFVPSLLTFIPLEWAHDGTYPDEKWPSDAVLLSEQETAEYWLVAPPEGKMLGAQNGQPVWVDIPPPTPEELSAAAARKKSLLLSEASVVIAPLRDAQDGGYIDESDKPKLIEWQKYRYALTKVDPANPVWPPKPAE
ncbi:tail fiber assembly protein [Citrobacter freundii]|nr:tail fiber assembly protein [Citrobacter freundii]HBU6166263.1 tail fiber assembly protein [Citrobacter freundii]HBV8018452.1 tail fiber assembly protein [Citrobacter freundii]